MVSVVHQNLDAAGEIYDGSRTVTGLEYAARTVGLNLTVLISRGRGTAQRQSRIVASCAPLARMLLSGSQVTPAT